MNTARVNVAGDINVFFLNADYRMDSDLLHFSSIWKTTGVRDKLLWNVSRDWLLNKKGNTFFLFEGVWRGGCENCDI